MSHVPTPLKRCRTDIDEITVAADINTEAYGTLSRIDKIRAHMHAASALVIPSPTASVPIAPIVSVSPKPDTPTEDPPSYRDLVTSNALTVGDRVFYIQRKGRRFYGDLLPDGRIRYSAGQTPSFEDLFFLSPTAFNNFCARMADPSYHRGNGFVYTFHKCNEDKTWVSLADIRRRTFATK